MREVQHAVVPHLLLQVSALLIRAWWESRGRARGWELRLCWTGAGVVEDTPDLERRDSAVVDTDSLAAADRTGRHLAAGRLQPKDKEIAGRCQMVCKTIAGRRRAADRTADSAAAERRRRGRARGRRAQGRELRCGPGT